MAIRSGGGGGLADCTWLGEADRGGMPGPGDARMDGLLTENAE